MFVRSFDTQIQATTQASDIHPQAITDKHIHHNQVTDMNSTGALTEDPPRPPRPGPLPPRPPMPTPPPSPRNLLQGTDSEPSASTPISCPHPNPPPSPHPHRPGPVRPRPDVPTPPPSPRNQLGVSSPKLVGIISCPTPNPPPSPDPRRPGPNRPRPDVPTPPPTPTWHMAAEDITALMGCILNQLAFVGWASADVSGANQWRNEARSLNSLVCVSA